MNVLQKMGCMVAPLLLLIKGKQASRMQKYHFVACGLVRSLTIVLALHARKSVCCVTQAFPVPSHQLLTGDQESGNEEEVRGTAQP